MEDPIRLEVVDPDPGPNPEPQPEPQPEPEVPETPSEEN